MFDKPMLTSHMPQGDVWDTASAILKGGVTTIDQLRQKDGTAAATPATTSPAGGIPTIVWIGGLGLVAYLLLRRKK